MIDIIAKRGRPLVLGHTGDGGAVRFIFSKSYVSNDLPDGGSYALLFHNPNGGIFPRVITTDADNIMWTPDQADTQYEGDAEIELRYTWGEDGAYASEIWSCVILRSLVPNGEAPTEYQSYVDEVTRQAGIVFGESDRAVAAAEDAAESASAAAESKAGAAEIAASVTESVAAAAASASEAAYSASGAASSAAAAEASEGNAQSAASAAANSASAASSSASTAGAKATAAASSASDAAGSASAAASSETEAAGSASSAAASAGSASDSASAASASATAAAGSASTASGYASAASASATEAAAAASSAAETAAQEAAAAVRQEVAEDAAAAEESAEDSEAWAVGQRGGTDVPSTDETYHNNSKYWAEQAAQAAGGGVSSFNGRSGAVLPQSGDYTAAMVGADPVGTASGLVAPINAKIPAQASEDNQLADKDFVNSSIENVAAYYITKNAAGDPFATKAELNAATVFYSGGAVRTPTRNDYCVVLADESKTIAETGENPTTRYLYYNGWNYQYIVNNTGLTAAQWAAVNSNITASKVTEINSALANISGKEDATNKVTSLSPSSTDAQYPSAKCVYNAIIGAMRGSY